MSFSRGPKDRGKRPVWHRIKLDIGKYWVGWTAGPCVGAETHFDKSSKPCRAYHSDGKLECDYCHVGWESRWYGYVPCWNRDGIRQLAVIGETWAKTVLDLPTMECVKVTRTTAWGNPYRIERSAELSGYPPIELHDRQPFDLLETLLAMWGDGELSAYLRKAGKRATSPKPAPPAGALTSDQVDWQKMRARLQSRGVFVTPEKPAPGQPGTLSEQMEKAHSKNGKGHK